jgi:hypothetical protein
MLSLTQRALLAKSQSRSSVGLARVVLSPLRGKPTSRRTPLSVCLNNAKVNSTVEAHVLQSCYQLQADHDQPSGPNSIGTAHLVHAVVARPLEVESPVCVVAARQRVSV